MVTWLFDEDSVEVVFFDLTPRYTFFVYTVTYKIIILTTLLLEHVDFCFIRTMLQYYQHLLNF